MRKVSAGCLLFCTVSAIALAPAAAAQTRDNSSDGDIVVTAQRRAENVQNVPVAVTAARGEQLQRANITTPDQLVRIDPSVSYRKSGSASTSGFQIRGIGTSSFSPGIEQSISTVVDGVVLADPSSVSTLIDVERVEVLRGPQGMLFGKNASAGLVSITTARPLLDQTEVTGRFEFGENNRRFGEAIVNLPLSNDIAIRVAAYGREQDGVAINRNPSFASRVDQSKVYGGMVKLLWKPDDRLSVYLLGDYSREDAFCCTYLWRAATPGYAPAVSLAKYGIVAGPDNRETVNGVAPSGYSRRGGVSLEADYEIGGATLTSITAWRDSKNAGYFDGDSTPVNYLDHNGASNDVEQFSQEVRIASAKGKLIDYVAGLYYFDSHVTGYIDQMGMLRWIFPFTGGQEIGLVPGVPDGTLFDQNLTNKIHSSSSAAFAQANLHATDRLNFLFGGRVTYDDLTLNYSRGTTPGLLPVPGAVTLSVDQKVNNTNFSWRVGAQYNVATDVMTYATVSRGYKGPGFSGLTVTSPTQDQRVAPEIPTSYEVGLRSSLFDKKLVFNLTLFLTDVKNFQAQVADLSSPTFANKITNAGSLRSKGVEFNALLHPLKGLTLSGGGTYLDAKYRDFQGVQCYFGQPKVAQGGPCVAPAADPTSPDGVFNARGERLAGAPRFSYSAMAEYRWDIGSRFLGGFQLNWNGQSDVNYSPNGDPGTIQKAFGTLGANLSFGTTNDRWRIGVFATNLLDKRWAAFIGPSPVTALNPGGYYQYFSQDSVRTIGVSLDLRL